MTPRQRWRHAWHDRRCSHLGCPHPGHREPYIDLWEATYNAASDFPVDPLRRPLWKRRAFRPHAPDPDMPF